MRISAVAFFMILTTVFLSGCGKTEMASLDNRGGNYYGKFHTQRVADTFASPAMPVQVQSLTPSSSDGSVTTSSLPAPAPQAMARSWQWPVEGRVTEKFGQHGEGKARKAF